MFIHKGGVYRQAADPRRDQKFRQEAQYVFKRVIRFLKEPYNLSHYVQRRGKFFQFRLDHFDRKYPVLFVLGPEGNRMRGEIQIAVKAPPHAPKHILVLYTLPPSFYDQSEYVQLERLHEYVEPDIWVHEFVHFLDDLRRKGPQTEDQTREENEDRDATRSREEYINTPTEYNAFYQQLLSLLVDHFREMTPEEYAEVEADFSNLLVEVEKVSLMSGLNYVENLNKKYRRKFLQRLYDWWEWEG
jgi:hypothetical protein